MRKFNYILLLILILTIYQEFLLGQDSSNVIVIDENIEETVIQDKPVIKKNKLNNEPDSLSFKNKEKIVKPSKKEMYYLAIPFLWMIYDYFIKEGDTPKVGPPPSWPN